MKSTSPTGVKGGTAAHRGKSMWIRNIQSKARVALNDLIVAITVKSKAIKEYEPNDLKLLLNILTKKTEEMHIPDIIGDVWGWWNHGRFLVLFKGVL